jgi:hypothetical protein
MLARDSTEDPGEALVGNCRAIEKDDTNDNDIKGTARKVREGAENKDEEHRSKLSID